MSMSLVCWGAQHWTQYSDVASPGLCRGAEVTSLGFLAMLLLMQGGCLLYLLWGHMTVHSCLTIHQDPKVLFCRVAFQSAGHQCVLMTGIISYCWIALTFSLVELHEVPVSPFLWPVKVPLYGSMNLCCISHFSKFCSTCELAEGALSPIIWSLMRMLSSTLHQSLGWTTSVWPPSGVHASGHSPVGLLHFPFVCIYFVSCVYFKPRL